MEEFDDIELNIDLLRGIYAYGFDTPSGIQKKGIPAILTNNDVLFQSQSGTGKTGAFCIGVLQKIDSTCNKLQTIILSPTRELAEQTYLFISALNKWLKYEITLLTSGVKLYNSKDQIIIATPGRLLYCLQNNIIEYEYINNIVIDEADQMLECNFIEQVRTIFTFVPSKAQVIVCSATLKRDTLNITHNFMNNPIEITLKREDLTLEGISQWFVITHNDEEKLECLLDLYSRICVSSTIIFCNSRNKVDWLTQTLLLKNFKATYLHSGMSKEERDKRYEQFKLGEYKIIVTSDLLSRGIDIQTVGFVINYELSNDRETYIHRIGRSGRYGRKGIAISLITDADYKIINSLEKFYGCSIKEMPSNIEDFL